MVEEKLKCNQEQLKATMGLIINGGNAKSLAFEAIYAAKESNFEEAQIRLKEADKALLKAHNSQTEMLAQEAAGNLVEVNLLAVHSQDHLMNAITFRDIAGEIVDLYQKLDELNKN